MILKDEQDEIKDVLRNTLLTLHSESYYPVPAVLELKTALLQNATFKSILKSHGAYKTTYSLCQVQKWFLTTNADGIGSTMIKILLTDDLPICDLDVIDDLCNSESDLFRAVYKKYPTLVQDAVDAIIFRGTRRHFLGIVKIMRNYSDIFSIIKENTVTHVPMPDAITLIENSVRDDTDLYETLVDNTEFITKLSDLLVTYCTTMYDIGDIKTLSLDIEWNLESELLDMMADAVDSEEFYLQSSSYKTAHELANNIIGFIIDIAMNKMFSSNAPRDCKKDIEAFYRDILVYIFKCIMLGVI